jgi:hypothetical protein
LELTSAGSEREQFPEIQKEISNETNQGITANRKWIFMESDDTKMAMMKLDRKNGDVNRRYYFDFGKLVQLHAEYII